MEVFKRCARCKEEKLVENFGVVRSTGRHKSYCRPCDSANQREWCAKNRDRVDLRLKKQSRERRRYAAAKRDKKCFDCGSPTDGSVYCGLHRNERAQREANRRGLLGPGKCKECGDFTNSRRALCEDCRSTSGVRFRKYHKDWYDGMVITTFNNYGGSRCVCCGETEWRFLTMDHINNDGNVHRRTISKDGRNLGFSMYRWLRKNNYPAGFQVLCFNCNCGKYRNGGKCPHQDQK